MTSPENPDVPEGMPRVDELFSRAVVAQLAEQRAQRETFAEVERKLEGLERLVTERLGELTRQLGTDGQLEGRIDLLEQTLGTRLADVDRAARRRFRCRRPGTRWPNGGAGAVGGHPAGRAGGVAARQRRRPAPR